MIGCTTVNWSGPDTPQSILLYGRARGRPAQILDGEGRVIVEIPMEYHPDLQTEHRPMNTDYDVSNFYALAADVWGDCREEVILFGARGLCIYTNPQPLADPKLYNETLYPGM
jgi:hypothetical protein